MHVRPQHVCDNVHQFQSPHHVPRCTLIAVSLELSDCHVLGTITRIINMGTHDHPSYQQQSATCLKLLNLSQAFNSSNLFSFVPITSALVTFYWTVLL